MVESAETETEMDDEVYNQLRNVLLVRSRDKAHDVRLLAVKALIYFQPQAEIDEDDLAAAAAVQLADRQMRERAERGGKAALQRRFTQTLASEEAHKESTEFGQFKCRQH